MKRIGSPPALPKRGDAAHKGTFGHALVVAGSRGMSGAAVLSGLSALRGGAGLVTLAIPEPIADVVASLQPSYITRPLPADRRGRFALAARKPLLDAARGCTASAIGPGLGQSVALSRIVESFLRELATPLVIDADGLNNLCDAGAFSAAGAAAEWPAPRILTPHPGEFSRMTGRTIKDIQKSREPLAGEFAARHGVVLVLKGAGTVVTDGERVFVNETGNSGMATGGSGDVLTGLVAALLAQRMQVFEAACLAVHLHGLAGDLAAAELSKPGLIASDLPDSLAEVLLHLTEGSSDE